MDWTEVCIKVPAATVDEAAANIDNILTRIRADLEEINTPKIVEVKVPVEILPTDDYCNIPAHRVWPVMFFVSLVLNVTRESKQVPKWHIFSSISAAQATVDNPTWI